MFMQIIQKILCIRVLDLEELFKQTLGELYSHRYLQQQQKHFSGRVFIFEVVTNKKSWILLKESSQLQSFFSEAKIKNCISKQTLEDMQTIDEKLLDRQSRIFELALSELCTANAKNLNLPFFQSNKQAYHTCRMKKLSGGRYRETSCCKMGAIFQGWKQRRVDIYLKGIGYFNQEDQLREFLSFSQGFHFQYGKPSTGKQFGLTLFANHRKLSLQAKNIKDFIYFLFILRKACEDSFYMSLNRFNSFAPIRYSNSTKFLIDGEEYFQAVASSITNAQSSILISGWMLSPEFLLKRGAQKISLEVVLGNAARRGVKISIIVYYQPCFLSNGSEYFKNKVQSLSQNITVLRHPCGKMPVLWSHHGKIVIIDQKQAFLGGLDICYGRFDNNSHDIFASESTYPGIEYNNCRKNDQFEVICPNKCSISRNQPRLPWHDVGINVKGKVVSDIVHHFYQLWHFIRYENRLHPENSYAPSLFEIDTKSLFSQKVIEKEEDSTIFESIENKIKTLRKKTKQVVKKVRRQIHNFSQGEGQQMPVNNKIRPEVNEDYFDKYLKQVNQEIARKQKNEQKARNKNNGRNVRRNSGMSMRFSVDQVKQMKQTIEKDMAEPEKLRKSSSFLLSGDKLIDFMSLDIDNGYIQCLQKLKDNKKKPLDSVISQKQVDSDEQQQISKAYEFQNMQTKIQGHDQSQVIRSVGNWSIGCHPNSTEFSIHIAYLQLISQAKHYIYIENQFFISSTADPEVVKNEVAFALYLRIVKAIQKKQQFKVYILLPLIPGFAGDLQAEDCLILRRQMQWQYDTICRRPQSLFKKLLTHTNDPGKYIQFLGLRTHGKKDKMSKPETQIIYLHSKLMIVDDQFILCGSANINDRSLMGDRDSEIAIVTKGQDFVEGKFNNQSVLVSQLAQQLRLKLWKQHFDFDQKQIFDPTCSQTWQKIANRVQRNTQLYRQIFGCYPDDEMTTRRKIRDIRQNSSIDTYDKLKDDIRGFAVEFPLNFLCDEAVTCLVTEKEFYMPTECLT